MKNIGYEGKLIEAENGIVGFELENGMFPYPGDYQCFVSIVYDDTDLRFGVMTLKVLDTDSSDYTEAVVKEDAFTRCLSRMGRVEDTLDAFIHEDTEAAGNLETIDARDGENTLGTRLDKVESGQRLGEGSVTFKTLTEGVKALFSDPAPELKNLYGDYPLTQGQYYVNGALTKNTHVDNIMVPVSAGEKLYASGFDFMSNWASGKAGIRVAMFSGDVWVSDLSMDDTAGVEYIIVPDGITKISIPYWQDDNDRILYIYSRVEIKGAMQKVKEVEQGVLQSINEIDQKIDERTTIIEEKKTYQNLYNESEIIKGQYYSSGKLTSFSSADTMPLISVSPGDQIYTSALSFASAYNSGNSGIRFGLFKDSTWVKDLTPSETKDIPYIVIPANVNNIACAFWADNTNRVIYNLTSGLMNDETVKTPVTDAVAAIKKQLEDKQDSPFAGKRVSILGDSISTFTGYIPDGNRARYPQSNLLTDVNLTWWKRLIDQNGMELGVNESWAGSLVSWNGTEGQDVGADKHIASNTRIHNLGDNGAPDYIFVFGGTNDVSQKTTLGTFSCEDPTKLTDEQVNNLPVETFADAYRAMLIRLLKWYPSARVICILPLYTSQTDGANLDQYNEIIKEACDYFGVPVVDTRAAGITMFNRNLYLPDGIHPNANGMELIYRCIQKELW